jgi:Formyl transferase
MPRRNCFPVGGIAHLMRVLLLSPYPEMIRAPILASGDDLRCSNASPEEVDFLADFVVSFGYRYIIKKQILRMVIRPIINVHISYLPWNRGADPNFWSWFDNTPKGVSIHSIDAGIDTGPVLVQDEIIFSEPQKETLATTYQKLQARAVALFAETWPLLRAEKIIAKPKTGGSYHTLKDKERWWSLLPHGYDTPVTWVMQMGITHATELSASEMSVQRDR